MARFKYYRYGMTKDVKLPKTGWVRSEADPYEEFDTIAVYDRMLRDSDIVRYGLVDLNDPVKKLTQFRSAAGYTQSELADAIGIPVRTIRSWETKGMNKASLDIAVKVADTVKCNVRDLLDDEDEDVAEE